MKVTLLVSSLGLIALGDPLSLETRYATERQLELDIETILELETVELEVERDGERMAPRGEGGASSVVQRISRVDRVLELDEDGAPKRVRRSFDGVGGRRSMSFGDQERDSRIESPFDGLVLELHGGGEARARVISGLAPASEALEGHRLTLGLDGLLPSGEVEVGDEWELDHDTIQRALGLDLAPHLFPRPTREPGAERGERGGRGGGGWGGGGGGADDLLSRAEWSGKARLVEVDATSGGMTCAAIELELEARGDLPERGGFGGGRGGRGGRGGVAELVGSSSTVFSNSFQIDLEGQMLFALEERRPVRLELEGDVRTERDTETTTGRGSMRMRRVEQGTLRHLVTITEGPVAAE